MSSSRCLDYFNILFTQNDSGWKHVWILNNINCLFVSNKCKRALGPVSFHPKLWQLSNHCNSFYSQPNKWLMPSPKGHGISFNTFIIKKNLHCLTHIKKKSSCMWEHLGLSNSLSFTLSQKLVRMGRNEPSHCRITWCSLN